MPRDIVAKPPRNRPSVGHISPVAHVLVYVLLLAMLAVDYIMLSQALTLLLRNDSQYGSIGLQMYVITLGVSLAVVSLPHVVAILLRRIQARVMARTWISAAVALTLIWAALLGAITVARIKAGLDAATDSGLTGLVGGSTEPVAPTFSWTAPDTIMAFLMLGVLTASGAISFIVAWLTTRPLLAAAEKAHDDAQRLRRHRDRLLAEAVKAHDATLLAQQLDAHDAVRYTGARVTFHSRVDVVRAQLATRLAQRERDPESTSQIIRELRARRHIEAPDGMPPLAPALSQGAVPRPAPIRDGVPRHAAAPASADAAAPTPAQIQETAMQSTAPIQAGAPAVETASETAPVLTNPVAAQNPFRTREPFPDGEPLRTSGQNRPSSPMAQDTAPIAPTETTP